jgi:PAS domain S-box-containing protein
MAPSWEQQMKGWTRFVDWPLRAKLTALLVVASLLPLIVATAIDIRDARHRALAQTEALLAARADQLVGNLDALDRVYRSAAERIAHLPNVLQSVAVPSIRKPAEFDTLHSLLSVMPANDSGVIATAILDSTGVVRAASNLRLVGANLAAHEFVQQSLAGASATSDIYFTDPQIGAAPAIAFAAPIFAENKQVAGLAVLWLRAAAVWDLMKASNGLAGAGSFAVLFDHQGIRIAHSYSQDMVFHPGAKLDKATVDALVESRRFGERTQEWLQDVRASPEQYQRSIAELTDGIGFRGFGPVNQQWNLGVGRRLQTVPWTVFYMLPEGAALAQIEQTTRNKALFAGIMALLALLVGALFAANILEPVQSLSTATEAIAGGKLATRVQVRRADELGRLGGNFNLMAARIETQAGELQRARDELEARVSARTAELARTAEHLKREIAERTKAEESARATRELLQGIVNSSDDAIISKRLDGIITSWNPAAERLFGFSATQAIGQPMLFLIPPERLSEEPEILKRIASGQWVDHFETVRVRADGTRIEISATISPLKDGDGRIVGASKIARDISERKSQERKLQAQLERMNLLQQITRSISERLDLPSIFQVVINTLEDRFPVDFGCICLYRPPDDFITVSCLGRRSAGIAGGIGLQEQSRVEIDGNGLSRCIRGQLVYEPDLTETSYAFPRRLAGGGLRSLVVAPLLMENQVLGVLVAARRSPGSFSSGECEFLRQLTEHAALAAQQAELYRALQTAYEDLRQTQQAIMQQERLRALGQMASGIAHDINNAISPIVLYTDVLLEKEPDLSERARGFLQTIQQAISDVADTVSRMREFYREREPQSPMMLVNLNRLAEQVVNLTRARWSDMALRRGAVIDVSTDLADALPDILGVESEIREALTNLLLNAVDALPNGGKIVLRTRLSDRPPNGTEEFAAPRVVLEVVDTGSGMDESTRQRCLEPFFTTKGEQGTGLGLAMVYGIAQRHAAEIEIESALGIGTTMRLLFPLPGADAGATIEPDSTHVQPSALRILIVDDDQVLLNSLRDALQSEGNTVVIAAGGQAGVDTFIAARDHAEAFDVVITDLGMPYVDGRKVAAAIKAASPKTPIILLTGWGQRLTIEGDVPPHVDRVLSKPPKLLQLRRALAELTAHSGKAGPLDS